MRRQLPPPRDPVGLASMVAGLRAHLSDAVPRNNFESEIRSSLDRSGLSKQMAERLLRNFEGIGSSVRQQALGSLDDRSFVPEKRQTRVGAPGTHPRPGSSALVLPPRTKNFDAPVGDVLLNPDEPPPGVRSYTIRYVGFHCDAERGDFGWSDEVYLCTTVAHISPNGDNVTRAVKHPVGFTEYGNVDAGDTRLGPIAACWQGLSDPISLTAVAFEHDQGDPNYYRDEVEAAVRLALAYASIELGLGASKTLVLQLAADLITDGINWLLGTGDDQTDIARTVILPIATLEAFGAKRKSWHYHVVHHPYLDEDIVWRTDLSYNFRTKHSGGGGRYVFGYDVVRDPPFPPREPDVD